MHKKSLKKNLNFDIHLRLNSNDYDFLSHYAVLNGSSVSSLIRDLIKSFIISKKGELSDEDFKTYLYS